MTLPRHLILFSKLPRLGRAKSRLARDVGRVEAWRFAEATTRSMVARLGHDPHWRTWLCLTPDGAFTEAARRWRGADALGFLPQGRGDLGVRMMRALAAVPPGPRLLMGSDIPGVGPAEIGRAFALLGSHDLVFGPAEDGGFWLVGARHPHVLAGVFAGVRWSTGDALSDTLANVSPGRTVAFAATMRDVDDGADLAAFREAGLREAGLREAALR